MEQFMYHKYKSARGLGVLIMQIEIKELFTRLKIGVHGIYNIYSCKVIRQMNPR